MHHHELTKDDGPEQVRTGRGWGTFALGHGPERISGRVDVTLRTTTTPGDVGVKWNVDEGRVTDEIKQRILSNANQNLHWYLGSHPEFGLYMTIDDASSDDPNRHDFDRATLVAMYDALGKASLPVWQIFEDE